MPEHIANNKNQLTRNSLILASTEVIVKVLGIVTTVFVARYLGAEQFGFLSFAYIIVGLCLVLPDYGLGRLVTREIARRPQRANRLLWHSTVVKLSLYLPAALICVIIMMFNSDDSTRLWLVMLVFMVEVLRQHMVFFCSYFRAIQQTEWEAWGRLFLAVFSLLLGVPALMIGWGIEGLMWIRFLVTLLSLGLIMWFLWQFGLQISRTTWRYVRALIKTSTPMALFTLFIMVYMSLNVLVLGFVKDDAVVGYYSVALMIINPLNIISDAVANASLPVLSQTWLQDKNQFHSTAKQSFRYLISLALPMSIGLLLLAEASVHLIFGAEYLPGVSVLMILALSLIPDYINTLLSTTLIAQDQEKTTLNATIFGAIIAVIACAVLIPKWGADGAALAWLLAEITVFIYQFIALKAVFWQAYYAKISLQVLLATLFMAVIVVLMQQTGLHIMLIIPPAIIAYVVGLRITGALSQQELAQLGQMIKRKLAK